VSLAVRIGSMASLYALRGQVSWCFGGKSRGVAVAAAGQPVVSRNACCAWSVVSISVRRQQGMSRKGVSGETNSLENEVDDQR